MNNCQLPGDLSLSKTARLVTKITSGCRDIPLKQTPVLIGMTNTPAMSNATDTTSNDTGKSDTVRGVKTRYLVTRKS
jgi:hypothetical protein